MGKRLVIIGASGHGKVVADIALKTNQYQSIVFWDDDSSKRVCGGYPVIGKSCDEFRYHGEDVIVAIGNAQARQQILERLRGKNIPILIHPNAVIAQDVKIGAGTVVMAGAVVNCGSIIGKGCIINTSSSIDHDCRVDDFVHVSVGACLAGTVSVGKRTWIGVGATVSNNIHITSDCIIGAGAVVTKSIDKKGIYIGVPAKRMDMDNNNNLIEGEGKSGYATSPFAVDGSFDEPVP